MNDSLYLLPYRLGALKPDALDTLETRVSSVTAPVRDFVPLFLFFPYARYALTPLVTISAIALPILALLVVPVTLLVGISPMTGYVSTVVSSPLYLAGVLTAGYSLALLRYKPTDKNDYTTVSTPTDPPEWETMFHMMVTGLYPLVYFLLQWHPGGAYIMNVTGQSPLILAILSGILGNFIVRKWFILRYAGDGVSAGMDFYNGSLMFIIPGWCLYLALIEFNIDLLVFGSAAEPTGAAFYILLAWSGFVLRCLRWTVYEDWAGFRTIHPKPRLWGLPRLPFMFAVFAVFLGAPISTPVVVGTVTPFIGVTGYILWRLWVTGDMMVNPDGSPGAGRRAYARRNKRAEENMMNIKDAVNAVNEFNEFAVNHDVDRLPDEQSFVKFDPDAVRDALDEIDAIQARELTGDAFTEYVEQRDNVRNKLNKL